MTFVMKQDKALHPIQILISHANHIGCYPLSLAHLLESEYDIRMIQEMLAVNGCQHDHDLRPCAKQGRPKCEKSVGWAISLLIHSA